MRDSLPDGADRCIRLLARPRRSAEIGPKVDAISAQLVAVSARESRQDRYLDLPPPRD
jgi:hypothetical protein